MINYTHISLNIFEKNSFLLVRSTKLINNFLARPLSTRDKGLAKHIFVESLLCLIIHYMKLIIFKLE